MDVEDGCGRCALSWRICFPLRHPQKLGREGQETNAVDEPRIIIQQPANLLYWMRLRVQKYINPVLLSCPVPIRRPSSGWEGVCTNPSSILAARECETPNEIKRMEQEQCEHFDGGNLATSYAKDNISILPGAAQHFFPTSGTRW